MNGKSSKMRAWPGLALVLALLSALCLTATAQEKTADDWVKKGNDLMNSKSWDDALAAYNKALQIDPQNESILLIKALDLDILKSQTATKALGIVEKKLDKNPQDALAWQAKGVALAYLDMMQEANKSFEKAIGIYDQEIQKNPKNGTAWWYKAENLANLQRFADALPAYEKVIELNSSSRVADAWDAKGGMLTALGRFNESLAAYDKAIELDPKKVTSWVGKSATLKEMGRDADSDAAYAKAVELGWGPKTDPITSF